MARVRVPWLAPALLISGCNTPPPDSPDGDVGPIVVDNGHCGDLVRFTGEYVDWDHTASMTCAISGARFESRDGGAVANTSAGGRFDLCLPNQPVELVEISQPALPTQCSTTPGSYKLPALAVASKDVFLAGGAWSGRAFVMDRQAVNPAKAQVFVHVHGPARDISIGAAHGPAQARTSSGWQPGTMGQDVFFQDVEIGTGETTITAMDAVVPARIPLVAGTMTNATIVAR